MCYGYQLITRILSTGKKPVAWYWNLRFTISEYLQDTQHGVSWEHFTYYGAMYQVLFQRNALSENNYNRDCPGQPSGWIDWLFHSSSLYMYLSPICYTLN